MVDRGHKPALAHIEWQTVLLIAASYLIWFGLLKFADSLNPALWVLLSAINITLFLSITHEVVHGHPTRNRLINYLMIGMPIGWSFAYERFRDTHIQHHETDELTDPFDDPETWYLAQGDWLSKNRVMRMVLHFNNTLFGRMLIGPIIGLGRFYAHELWLILFDNRQRTYLLMVWLKHLVLCALMAGIILSFSDIPVWQWIISIYLGHSILLVRTFLEHQAADDHSERTVIIEQACPIAFLFLFNNYHFVHHDRPHIPWYQLPKEFKRDRESYLSRNGTYRYRSYAEVFRKFFFRAKEPVPHPFLHSGS